MQVTVLLLIGIGLFAFAIGTIVARASDYLEGDERTFRYDPETGKWVEDDG